MFDEELANSTSKLVDTGLAEIIINQTRPAGLNHERHIWKKIGSSYKEGLVTTGQNIHVGNDVYVNGKQPSAKSSSA